uniref:Choline transporter-like protein n=1 Tax=Cyclopterus lumpus TaxID=8103 RepID=A0A8C2XF39_CYCLU
FALKATQCFLFPGEPAQFDPTFKGPMKKRGCTDIICCVLFMAVILGYIAVGILAWLFGDPRHVLYPRNSTGWFCGIEPNEGRPNLFYFDILKCATSVNVMATALNGLQCPTTQVCVDNCPDQFWAVRFQSYLINSDFVMLISFSPPSVLGRCLPNIPALGKIPSDFLVLVFVFNRDIVNGFNAREIGVLALTNSTTHTLPPIGPLSCWSVSLVGIWHCYWEYDNYKQLSATITDIGFTTNLNVYLQVQETWLAFLIIISVAEAIILLTIIFLRTRILIAIALIQESSKAISHMMSSMLYPLVTFVLLLVCVAYWGATALYLATSGGPIYKVVALNSTVDDCSSINGTVDCDPQVSCPLASCIFIKYNDEGLFQRNLFNLQIYNAVAFLWCVNFVIALGQCTLAGAFASYYWAFTKPDDIPMFPLSASFIRSLRYHVGSLAFGALILTLVQIARMILEYIDHKTRAAQNPCARFILCCMKCCLWCLEKFIKFLNRNAYIMIAIYGKNFCVSAKNAFLLLMRNVVRVVVLDKVTDLLLFFGKLLVVAGVGILSFFFFSGRILLPGHTFRSETLNYYWMPIITVVFGSYLIAHGFFSVYNMCVDTLFLCFLEDLERNDGSLQKPYFMSKNLMKILNKSNKAQKKVKGED